MWVKYIEMAQNPKNNVNDSMIASYMGQALGLPLIYEDELVVKGRAQEGYQFNARISDVLCATGDVQPRKKPAKAAAAKALVKLVLKRFEDEATRFVY
jgi:hypothetical protein